MSVQRLGGVETAQVRALADALDDADDDARLILTLADEGVLHVQVDPPDRDQPSRWLAVTVDAAVLPSTGPATLDHVDPAAVLGQDLGDGDR